MLRRATDTIQAPLRGWISDTMPSNAGPLEAPLPGHYTLSDGIDLFRQGKRGHLAPAQIFNSGAVTDGSSNINSLARAATVDITQNPPYVFFILGGLGGTAPRVIRVLNTAYDSHQTISAHGGHNFTTLPGTGFWGEDVALYKPNISSTPSARVMYSWNDNADGDIGAATLAGLYDDDFMSTVPTGAAVLVAGVPHRLVEGDTSRILYCTNGPQIAQYDGATGANGTFNATKLALGFGWVTVDHRNFNSYLAVAAIKAGNNYSAYSFSSEAKVILWDMSSQNIQFTYGVEDNFVSAIFVIDTVYAFTRGRSNTTKVKRLENGRFRTIFEAPTASIGTPPDPRSIDFYDGNLTWAPGNGQSSYICCLSLVDGSFAGFHVPYIAHDGTNAGTTLGMVKNIDGKNLYLGMLSGAAYKVPYLDGTGGYRTSVTFRSDLRKLPYRSTIKHVTPYFSQFGTGASATFKLYKDYGSTDFLNRQLTRTANGALSGYAFQTEIGDVNSYRLDVTFDHASVTNTAAIIRQIEVEYEYDDAFLI